MSVLILQVIASLIGEIIIVQLFNCATWSFPAHKFRQWANLASIFLVISLLLEQQTWFRVCVLPVVPIPFRFHHSFDLMSSSINYIFLKTSRQTCRDHCQQFDFFQVVCRNSGWEIPSLPLDELCYHRQHSCLPPTQTCSCFVLYLEILAIQHLFLFTLEYYHPLYQECLENFTTL